VIDPKNPRVLYAGTGEGFFNNDALRGSGIFRTTDGVRWEQLQGTGGPEFSFINRIAVSPDGSVLLVAARGPDKDYDPQRIFDPNGGSIPPGIFRSDDANHSKWTRV